MGGRDTGISMAILLDSQNPLPFTEGLQLRAWMAFLTAPTLKELSPIQVQDSKCMVSELISWEGGAQECLVSGMRRAQDAYMGGRERYTGCMRLCECTCVCAHQCVCVSTSSSM